MGFLEAAFGRLFSWLLGGLSRLIGSQRAIRVHFDTEESVLAYLGSASDGTAVMTRNAVLRVYNRGPQRRTVNRGGWLASDGAVLEGWPTTPATLEPGGVEHRISTDALNLVKFADSHSRLTHAYLELAGEAKHRTYKVPSAWMARVREVAAKAP